MGGVTQESRLAFSKSSMTALFFFLFEGFFFTSCFIISNSSDGGRGVTAAS